MFEIDFGKIIKYQSNLIKAIEDVLDVLVKSRSSDDVFAGILDIILNFSQAQSGLIGTYNHKTGIMDVKASIPAGIKNVYYQSSYVKRLQKGDEVELHGKGVKRVFGFNYDYGIIVPFSKDGILYGSFALFSNKRFFTKRGVQNLKIFAKIITQTLLFYKKVYDINLLKETMISKDRQYKQILENISDLVLKLSPTGRILFVNSDYLSRKFLGKPMSEVLGKHLQKVMNVDKKELKRVLKEIFNAIRNKKDFVTDIEVEISLNGDPRWYSLNISFEREDGKYYGSRMILRDITIKRTEEEKLKEVVTKLDSVLKALPFGTIILDDDFSIRFSQLSKVHLKEDAKDLEELFPISRDVDLIKENLPKHELFEMNTQAMTVSGRVISVKVTGGKIEGGMSLGKYLLVVEDISEKVRLQEQLISREALAVLGQMSAGISHEIGNIMTIIMRNATYSLKKDNVSVYREKMKIIEEQAKRGDVFVKNLMKLAGAKETIVAPVDIGRLIEDTLAFFRSDFDKYGIKVSFGIIGNERIVVEGDRYQLQTVFINLIMNSIHAIIEKKYEEGESGKIDIKVSKKKYFVSIVFEDNGIGIPKKYLNKIFQPFFSTKRESKYGGSGIGLSICNTIIERHRGYIYADSEEGKGSKFVILLPIEIS